MKIKTLYKETRTPSLPSPILQSKNGGGKLDDVGATLHGKTYNLSGEIALHNVTFLAKGELPLVRKNHPVFIHK